MWSRADENIPLETNCNLTEDWAHFPLPFESGDVSGEDSAIDNFISTIIVLTDFRNSLGAELVESTDPTTFELFLTDDDPSFGLDEAKRASAKYRFEFNRGELT